MTAGLLSPTQAFAVDDVNTAKLRKAVTVNGILQHERALQRIANQNGGTRASGTPGYDASADYVVEEAAQGRLQGARAEVHLPVLPGAGAGRLCREVTPDRPPTTRPAPSPTPASGDVTGPVVPTNDIVDPADPDTEQSQLGLRGRGLPAGPPAPTAIALIQRGTCNFEVKADNAKAAGYDAAIIFNEGQPGRTDLLTGTLGAPETIPVVGAELRRRRRAVRRRPRPGRSPSRVTTSTETDPNRTTVNVIADSPKGKTRTRSSSSAPTSTR